MSIELDFSNEVYVKRTLKGFTQEQLAEAMDVSTRWIQRIEKGDILPGSHLLIRLVRFLDIDLRCLRREA